MDKNAEVVISQSEAKGLVKAFQTNYQDNTMAFYVWSNHLNAIHNQVGFAGLRIYNTYVEQNLKKKRLF